MNSDSEIPRFEFGPECNAHDGGPMPVGPETKVRVRYRNGLETPTIYARQRRWTAWPDERGTSDWDIVGWCLDPAGNPD